MDAGNMRKSFGGDRTFGSGGMLADRQTCSLQYYNNNNDGNVHRTNEGV